MNNRHATRVDELMEGLEKPGVSVEKIFIEDSASSKIHFVQPVIDRVKLDFFIPDRVNV